MKAIELHEAIKSALLSADVMFLMPGELDPMPLLPEDIAVISPDRICIRIARPVQATIDHVETMRAPAPVPDTRPGIDHVLQGLINWLRHTHGRIAALEAITGEPADENAHYAKLAASLNYEELAESCADYIDAERVAKYVDTSDIAGHIDASDIAEHIDASDIAEEMDLTEEVREALRSARFRLE
jgi:hypothetical protein